jgi:hypothetical protein
MVVHVSLAMLLPMNAYVLQEQLDTIVKRIKQYQIHVLIFLVSTVAAAPSMEIHHIAYALILLPDLFVNIS